MNKDFARGMIVSMALKALPVRKKSPIAYLYNGVRLPALPEWDRERYPYVCMSRMYDSGMQGWDTVLHMSSEPPVYTGVIFGNTAEIPAPRLICEINRDLYSTGVMEWTELKELTDSVYGVGSLYEIFWSNVDILQDDGTAYVTASTPIPIYNEPVNYLYNGVKLPKLPEWDKTVYPYAVIIGSDGAYRFCVDDAVVTVGTGDTAGKWNERNAAIVYKVDGTEWVTASALLSRQVIWSNHDVYDYDGTRYLSASEPVPTYE